MNRFSQTILAYHGCEPAFAAALIRGEMTIDQWQPSQNAYDWLGRGIYFWEHAIFGEKRRRQEFPNRAQRLP